MHQRPAALGESITAYNSRCSGRTLLTGPGNSVPIPLGCLLAAISDGHYVILETSVGTKRIRSSLREVADKLPPSFMTVNRGIVVNMDMITDIEDGAVILKGSPKGELKYHIRKGAYKKTAEHYLRYRFSGLTGQTDDK